MNPIWKAIDRAKHQGVEIVWLPESRIAVSAIWNPDMQYWGMTDRSGGEYCLPLDEQPTHVLADLEGPTT